MKKAVWEEVGMAEVAEAGEELTGNGNGMKT